MKNADRDYEIVLSQIRGVTTGETDLTANLANVCAVLKSIPGYFWVGFYLLKEGELVLGPFQGPVACTRIPLGKGVCGAAFDRGETLLVPDVHAFPGHIACSAASQSELVVPVFDRSGSPVMVLDVDSDLPNAFSQKDAAALEETARILTAILP